MVINSVQSLEEIREMFEKSPFLNHMGITVMEVEEGYAKIELPVNPSLANVNNSVHGGVHAVLLDAVLGITMRSLASSPVVTVSLTVHYFAPVDCGSMISTAKVVHQGRSIMTGEGEVTDANGKLIAKGTGTFKVLRSKNK